MTKAVTAGRPFKQDSTLSKGKILSLAMRLIEEEGEKAASFRALAKKLDVTPMAVSHHVGNRQLMLEGLIARAFYGVGSEPKGDAPTEQLRFLLARYCDRVLKHPNLFKCVLADPRLIEGELFLLTDLIKSYVRKTTKGDNDNALLNLIVDYTHGFALSVSAAPSPPQLTTDDYLRSLDWILERLDS